MCRYVHLSFFGIFTINIFSQPINDSPQLSGWDLVWHDEFDSDSINYDDWEHDIGTGALTYTEYGISSTEFVPPQFPSDNFSVQWNGFISPESFTFIELAIILAIVVLGGMGSQVGVVLAASAIVLLPEFLREFSEYRMLFFGMSMVLVMLWRPQGLMAYRAPTVSLRQADST